MRLNNETWTSTVNTWKSRQFYHVTECMHAVSTWDMSLTLNCEYFQANPAVQSAVKTVSLALLPGLSVWIIFTFIVERMCFVSFRIIRIWFLGISAVVKLGEKPSPTPSWHRYCLENGPACSMEDFLLNSIVGVPECPYVSASLVYIVNNIKYIHLITRDHEVNQITFDKVLQTPSYQYLPAI